MVKTDEPAVGSLGQGLMHDPPAKSQRQQRQAGDIDFDRLTPDTRDVLRGIAGRDVEPLGILARNRCLPAQHVDDARREVTLEVRHQLMAHTVSGNPDIPVRVVFSKGGSQPPQVVP